MKIVTVGVFSGAVLFCALWGVLVGVGPVAAGAQEPTKQSSASLQRFEAELARARETLERLDKIAAKEPGRKVQRAREKLERYIDSQQVKLNQLVSRLAAQLPAEPKPGPGPAPKSGPKEGPHTGPVGPVATGSKCPGPRLTSTDYDGNIETLLRNASPPITSVEQFLDCLPEEFFAQENVTYVTKSESPEQDDVSEAHPRPILSDGKGKTIVSYTGKRDGKFRNEVRLIVRGAGPPPHNRFIAVSFDGKSAPKLDESGKDCVSCHRGGHLWGSYRNWPGTFAPKSDLEWVPEEKAGYFAYQKFRTAEKDSDRYGRAIRNARGDGGVSVPGAHAGEFRPREPYVPSMGYLLERISPLKAESVMTRLKASPLFEQTKFLLAGVFLGCDLDPDVWSNLERTLEQQFGGDPSWQKFKEYAPQLKDRSADPFYRELAKVELLVNVGRLLGVSGDEWSTDFTKRDVRSDFLRQDAGPAMSLGSGSEIRDLVFSQLMKVVGKNPALVSIASSPGWKGSYPFLLNERYADRNPSGYGDLRGTTCAALSPLIRGEFAGKGHKDLAQRFPHPTLVSRCSECHTGRYADVPPIPFDKTADFQSWLERKGSGGKTGRELLAQRVFQEHSMPPGGGLSAEDRLRMEHELAQLGSAGKGPGRPAPTPTPSAEPQPPKGSGSGSGSDLACTAAGGTPGVGGSCGCHVEFNPTIYSCREGRLSGSAEAIRSRRRGGH